MPDDKKPDDIEDGLRAMQELARGLPRANSTYEPPQWHGIVGAATAAKKTAYGRDLRRDIANAIEQSERSAEKKTVSHDSPSDRTLGTYLDYSGLGAILFAIEEMGRRWFEEQQITQHHWVAFAAFMIAGAIALGWARRIKNMPTGTNQPLRGRLSASFDAVAHNAITWLVTAAIIIFGVPITFWAISPPPQIHTHSFGFAEALRPQPASAPTAEKQGRYYSAAERDELANRIATIYQIVNSDMLEIGEQWLAIYSHNITSKSEAEQLLNEIDALNVRSLNVHKKLWQDTVNGNPNFSDELRKLVAEDPAFSKLVTSIGNFRDGVSFYYLSYDSLTPTLRLQFIQLLRPFRGSLFEAASDLKKWVYQTNERIKARRQSL